MLPLSQRTRDKKNPISACGVCGEKVPAEFLDAWRESDEAGKPQEGPLFLVFIDTRHQACQKVLEDHERAYVLETGAPGSFPHLCGPCRYRTPELTCSSLLLKSRGGPGLQVDQTITPEQLAVLTGGGPQPVAHAVACSGRDAGNEARGDILIN
jgi:hypothetical protein